MFNLAISPCPNDTFMFYKFIVDHQHYFRIHFSDIEELNEGLLSKKFDISKCSVALYPFIAEHYALLPTGMAMGFGTGPLLIAKNPNFSITEETRMGIPGKYTTAYALLRRYFPQVKHIQEFLFSSIPDEILKNTIDAGVIIHETRFTYEQKKLVKLEDLGSLWEQETKLPLPLGAIVIRRDLITSHAKRWSEELAKSIHYAWSHMDRVLDFCRLHATEIEEQFLRQHIELYVNDFSLEPGEEGKKAVEYLISSVKKEAVSLSNIWAL